jgi:integrase
MEIDKITIPQSDKRDENYLSKTDMQTLWGYFKQTKTKHLGWFLFSYLHGGMNIADMMGLRFTDFWFSEGGFVYQREKTKGKNNFKVVVPATTWTSELLDIMGITPTKGELVFKDMGGLRQSDKGYAVAKNRLSNNANQTLKAVGKKAGVGKSISMTVARHSFATTATKERMPFAMIERTMGHSTGGVSSHYIGGFTVDEMRPDFEKLL